jgi:hypothetical protein
VRTAAFLAAAAAIVVASGSAELNDKLSPALDHPAIEYFNYLKHPGDDVVGDLKRKIESGKIRLSFDGEKGYLPAVLQALNIPVESQMAVFSKTSFQATRIEPGNPRTIFFNDSVAVAWMHGGFIELAAQDPQQGVIFYTLEQSAPQPSFIRRDDCLSCHRSDLSLGVPGMILRSFYTLPDGGWYVTGSMAHARHMGNATLSDPDHPESMITDGTLDVASLQDKFDTNHYLSAHSDLVALLVFDHQMYMTNLITRVGWEVRCALYDHASSRALAQLLRESANELVDYLLFIDEAPLPGPVHGTSGFAEKFAARGPLRQLDLETRLLRYPCSYMIYSPAFDSLPEQARGAIYQRLWEILSGAEKGKRYARLSLADRQAIVKILRETKPGLPGYFQPVTR